MSTRQVLAAAREPYRRLLAYLKPYRKRFYLGILFGILTGMTNVMLIHTTRMIGETVLTAEPGADRPARGVPLPEGMRNWLKSSSLLKGPGGSGKKDKGPHDQATPASDPAAPAVELAGPPAPTAADSSASGPAGTQADHAVATAPEKKAPLSKVLMLCALLPLAMCMRGMMGYVNSYFMTWVSIRVLDDIRQQTFESVLRQSQEFFNKQKTGDLIQTIFNQTRMAQMALTQIASDIVRQPAAILAALISMLTIDWMFTVLSFSVFPIFILPALIIGKWVRKQANKEEEEAGVLMNTMHEALGGIRVVKGHSREDFEADRFATSNRQMLKLAMRWRNALELTGPMVETSASIGIAVALIYAWKTNLSAGEFMALNMALALMYEPAKSLGRLHVMMQKCLAATTKIFELMDRPVKVPDAPDAVAIRETEGRIEFHNVRLVYNKQSSAALNGVSLVIPPGTTCALVGPSGAGKSSMISLLMRFYDPNSGYITLDGHDLRRVTQKSLREQIGLVNQDIFLFHDTIYQNIRYGRLDATREEIEDAAKRAFAHDFILKQPKGYESVVGDMGCNLSGGQKQRVCIARAILRNAPILILDEATSALDSEAEAYIQAAIDDLAKNKTVIAIAHRLSTVLQADQIVVMDHGRVVDAGPHAELLERNELYQRLYRRQFSDD